MVLSLNSDTLQLRLSTLIFTSVKDFYCHFITFLIYNSTYPERFIAFTAVNSINSPIFSPKRVDFNLNQDSPEFCV